MRHHHYMGHHKCARSWLRQCLCGLTKGCMDTFPHRSRDCFIPVDLTHTKTLLTDLIYKSALKCCRTCLER